MLVVSAGMQKSGSAYLYNIINDLMTKSNGIDAREFKKKHGLGDLMQWHNNNVGELTFLKLFKLWRISILEGPFAVKTHNAPSLSLKVLNKLGMVKIIYSYRDPRDVLLSAIDHGKKIIEEGEAHTFAKMITFEKALQNVKGWLIVWKCYTDMSGVLSIRYEDIMVHSVREVDAIVRFLNLSVSTENKKDVLWQYSKDNHNSNKTGMHFNKAQIYRYKTDMTEQEKHTCKTELSEYIVAMGYET